jgi:hypothetical protein
MIPWMRPDFTGAGAITRIQMKPITGIVKDLAEKYGDVGLTEIEVVYEYFAPLPLRNCYRLDRSTPDERVYERRFDATNKSSICQRENILMIQILTIYIPSSPTSTNTASLPQPPDQYPYASISAHGLGIGVAQYLVEWLSRLGFEFA